MSNFQISWDAVHIIFLLFRIPNNFLILKVRDELDGLEVIVTCLFKLH